MRGESVRICAELCGLRASGEPHSVCVRRRGRGAACCGPAPRRSTLSLKNANRGACESPLREAKHDPRSVDPRRRGGGRFGRPALSRRCRRGRRAHRPNRPYPRARPARHRRRRFDPRARFYRRPHSYGRPGRVGPARQLFLLARRDQRRHGQLRLRPRPLPSGRARMDRPLPRSRRGHPHLGDDGGHRLDLGEFPRLSRDRGSAAEGHQLRRLSRPFGAAHVRYGRTRALRSRDRGRPRRHARRGHGGAPRRRDGVLDLARDHPRHPGRHARAEPHRRVERDRCAGGRHGRTRRGNLPDRARHLQRRRATRLSRPPAPGGARQRPPGHVRNHLDAPGARTVVVAGPARLHR